MVTLKSFDPLTPAEEKLLAECASPARIMVGDGELPTAGESDGSVAKFSRVRTKLAA